ncbi:MAG: hypothetical protein K6T72_11500 [Anoxybacillus sp.]|nr:Wzz/FepE/Etk N-terminal domain-containing protein [Anoxybacillus sp.]MCL6587114.1 hypothetical protein [Anoxybacillus sp.]
MEKKVELIGLVNVVLTQKWIVVGITAIAVLISALASFLLVEPVYSVKATVSVNNGLMPGRQLKETDIYFNEMVTPSVYVEHIKSPQVIGEAIKKSGLEQYTIGQVQASITVENVQNTNLINITLKGKNASDTKNMLDSILITAKELLLKEIQQRVKEDSEQLAIQVKDQKEELEQLLKEYNQKAQSLQLSSFLLLDTIISHNNQYMINLDQGRLPSTGTISEKDLLSLSDLSNKIQVYSDNYREYLTNQQQLQGFLQTVSVDDKILTLSAPLAPQTPDSPNRLLNIIIGFVVGFAASIGVVFFRHYWRQFSRS